MRVGLHPPLGLGDAEQLEHVDGAVEGLAAALALVEIDRLDDLVAHRVDRVERGHRLLEDHAEIVAAERPHRHGVELGEILHLPVAAAE